MADRPIIFSAPVVRSLIAGRKTQTRRVLKLPTKTSGKDAHRIYEHPKMGGWEPTTSGGDGCFTIARDGSHVSHPERVAIWHRTCGVCIEVPHQVGDRLWVRENWWSDFAAGGGEHGYLADNEPYAGNASVKRASSMMMPRRLSRLTLTVTDVRVERLQDISEEDAIAESMILRTPTPEEIKAHKKWCDESDGEYEFNPIDDTKGLWYAPGTRQGYGLTKSARDEMKWAPTAACAFRFAWEAIHGRKAWNENPWIAAITFAVHHSNIDAMKEAA